MVMKMKSTRKEIPHWAWYNGQFLFKFQESLERNPYLTIGELWSNFKKDQKLEGFDFGLKNQGTVLMLLYGLLVVPKEIWGTDKIDSDFKFETKKELIITKPCNELSNSDIIRRIRNAVSHANFEVYADLNQYIFWNMNRKGQRDFEAVVSHEGLGKFLTEVGKYYINQVIVSDDS